MMESNQSVTVNIPLVQQQSASQNGPKLRSDQLYAALPLTGLRCTRVLDLEADKNPFASLRGTLRVVDLQTSPHFTALSYVWGESTSNEHTISCDGVDVSITKSCYEALCSLRQMSSSSLTIWVDAICIHQGNNEEKKTQIPLMDEIFTWAQTVYIWLGPGTDSTDRVMDWLLRATKYQPHTPGIPWVTGEKPTSMISDLIKAGLGMILASFVHSFHCMCHDHCLPRLIEAVTSFSGDFVCSPRILVYFIPTYPDARLSSEDVCSLLGREWHRRAWTFQELILASNPVLVCGTRAIDWAAFFGGIYIWSNFLNPWDFLSRANLRHYQLSKDKRSENNGLPPRPVSSVLLAWGQLFMTWVDAKRPTHWNTVKRRGLPDQKRESWSIQNYQTSLTTATYVLRALKQLIWISVVVTFISLPFILSGTRSNAPVVAATAYIIMAGVMGLVGVCIVIWRVKILYEYTKQAPQVRHSTQDTGGAIEPLLGILRALRERRASVAKDMSFAMHGILRRLDVPVSSADYDKPLGLVYRELFEDLVRWHPALINLLVDVGSTIPGMPSWVPDWSTVHERLWLEPELLYAIADIDNERNAVPKVGLLDDNLIVSGIKMATVTYWSGPAERIGIQTSNGPDQDDQCFAAFQHSLHIILRWITQLRRDVSLTEAYDRVPEAAFRVLCGVSGKLDRRTMSVFDDIFRTLVSCTDVRSSLNKANPVTQNALRRAFDELKHMPPALDLIAKLVNEMVGKRGLFLTEGHAGSGPTHMAIGDEVLVIKGLSVPMIARRKQNSEPTVYTLVGPAFVHGFMGLNFEPGKRGKSWEDIIFQ